MALLVANQTSFKKGMVPWNKGKVGLQFHTQEWKEQNSLRNKGKHISEEHKKKISEKNSVLLKGRKLSEETKKKMSLARKGRNISPETRLKISKANMGKLGLKGNLNPNWKGGYKPSNGRSDSKYHQFRSNVFQRDNWTCKTCNKNENVRLEVHHIKSWTKFPELRYELENGVTLCRECHKLTDNYGGKKLKQ